MNGLRAPDVAAYLSYGIVLLVGSIVAVISVNTLLGEKRDRWSYLATWALVAAYALLPVALFWFLDYQGVIADTSLFAALIVAAGYRQVLSGAVEGIRLPGQTAAIWGLFKAWVERVEKRIDRLNQSRNAHLTEQIVTFIAASDERALKLETLVLDRSKLTTTLGDELKDLKKETTGSEEMARRRRVVKRLWNELRVAEPETYGDLLRADGLLQGSTYWWTFRNVRSVAMCVAIVALAVAVGYEAFRISRPKHGDFQLAFYEWRFTRPTLTSADEFRARKELLIALKDPQIPAIGPSLVESLTYRDSTRRDSSTNSGFSVAVPRGQCHTENVRTASARAPDAKPRCQITASANVGGAAGGRVPGLAADQRIRTVGEVATLERRFSGSD